MNAVGQTSAAAFFSRCADAWSYTSAVPAALTAANDTEPRWRPRTAVVTLPAFVEADGREVAVCRTEVRIVSEGERPVTHPVSTYRGVAVRVEHSADAPVFRLTLEHEDASLTVLLASGTEIAEVANEWQAWGKALSLPLIAVEPDGTIQAELNTMGVVLAERPSPRRRGSPLVGRRSRFARMRRAAPLPRILAGATVVEGEREIIARS